MQYTNSLNTAVVYEVIVVLAKRSAYYFVYIVLGEVILILTVVCIM